MAPNLGTVLDVVGRWAAELRTSYSFMSCTLCLRGMIIACFWVEWPRGLPRCRENEGMYTATHRKHQWVRITTAYAAHRQVSESHDELLL